MSANAAIRRQSVFSGLPCRAETLWLSKALLLLVFFVVVVVFSIGSHGTGVVTYIHLADLLIFLWVSCWQICHTWHGSCGFWHLSVLFLSFPICHVRQRNIPSEPIFVPRPTLQSGQILFFLVGFSGHKFPHPVLGKSVILPIQDPMVLSRNEKCLLLSVLMSWKKTAWFVVVGWWCHMSAWILRGSVFQWYSDISLSESAFYIVLQDIDRHRI